MTTTIRNNLLAERLCERLKETFRVFEHGDVNAERYGFSASDLKLTDFISQELERLDDEVTDGMHDAALGITTPPAQLVSSPTFMAKLHAATAAA